MAILKDIAGLGACGLGASIPKLGTRVGCLKAFQNMKSPFFKKKRVSYPKNTDFTDAFLLAEEQKGNIIVLPSDVVYTQGGGENSKAADAIGKNRLQTKGLVEFTAKFEEVEYYYQQLHKLSSFDEWEFVPVDDINTFMMVDDVSSWAGLTVGLITDDAQKFGVEGGDAGSKSIYFQLIDRDQLDSDLVPFYFENHGVTFRKHSGISGAVINVIGAGAGTTINVDVFLVDNKTALAGLATGNLKAVVNGVDNVITSIVAGASAEKYILTLTTAVAINDSLVIQTDDSVVGTVATNVIGEIYSGISDAAVVA